LHAWLNKPQVSSGADAGDVVGAFVGDAVVGALVGTVSVGAFVGDAVGALVGQLWQKPSYSLASVPTSVQLVSVNIEYLEEV
jgi:hypothetical protein